MEDEIVEGNVSSIGDNNINQYKCNNFCDSIFILLYQKIYQTTLLKT